MPPPSPSFTRALHLRVASTCATPDDDVDVDERQTLKTNEWNIYIFYKNIHFAYFFPNPWDTAALSLFLFPHSFFSFSSFYALLTTHLKRRRRRRRGLSSSSTSCFLYFEINLCIFKSHKTLKRTVKIIRDKLTKT